MSDPPRRRGFAVLAPCSDLTASLTRPLQFSRHEGPVWQVCWAHPKFGSMIASCSYDHKVPPVETLLV